MSKQKTSRPPEPDCDSRFRQLLELARNGNQEAAADLFREFGFRFGEEETP